MWLQSLDAEMKKLQDSTKEATERFDEALTKLLETKVKHTAAIYQVSQHRHTHPQSEELPFLILVSLK